MESAPESATEEILRAVGERIKDLDPIVLQEEIQVLQLENQELNRQLQERSVLLQLRQLEMQRQAERASGISIRLRSRPDRELQRRVDQLHEIVGSIDDQVIQAEIGRLQSEVQEMNRQMQERQHLLALKQMVSQQVGQAPIGFQVNVPFVNQQMGVQIGVPFQQLPTPVHGPRLDAATKRQAILDVMREQPTRLWKPAEVKRTLGQRGLQNVDEGTPVRNLLWKMHQEGLIERPRAGVYSIATPALASEADRTTDG